MPPLYNPPRQELTVQITNTSNLVDVEPPLTQKLLTTQFLLSFDPLILQFLQIPLKTSNFFNLYSSNSGPSIPNYRAYVLRLQCTRGQSQHLWLFCSRVPRDGPFLTLSSFGTAILLHIFHSSRTYYPWCGSLAHAFPLKSELLDTISRIYGSFEGTNQTGDSPPKASVGRDPKSRPKPSERDFGLCRPEIYFRDVCRGFT